MTHVTHGGWRLQIYDEYLHSPHPNIVSVVLCDQELNRIQLQSLYSLFRHHLVSLSWSHVPSLSCIGDEESRNSWLVLNPWLLPVFSYYKPYEIRVHRLKNPHYSAHQTPCPSTNWFLSSSDYEKIFTFLCRNDVHEIKYSMCVYVLEGET